MTAHLQLHLGALVACSVVMLCGCSKGVHGGDPALPLSDTKGTTGIFHAPEILVRAAISNAFAAPDDNPMGYRGMDLRPAAESFIGTNWHVTNGFVLFPLAGPIARVPLRGRPVPPVPYKACFNITTRAEDTSTTTVSVRTVFAKVIDGEELGVHGGWANHERDVPPVRLEEQNVVSAISNALASLTNPRKAGQ